MGLKKRAKVSAQFSMSSLTDIIFLLLIFFMLTSTLVSPNALNLKLPGSSSPPSASQENPNDITIKRNGTYLLDGRRISKGKLDQALGRLAKSAGRKKLDITISPEKNTPVEHVVAVMDMAMRLKINAILATDKE